MGRLAQTLGVEFNAPAVPYPQPEPQLDQHVFKVRADHVGSTYARPIGLA